MHFVSLLSLSETGTNVLEGNHTFALISALMENGIVAPKASWVMNPLGQKKSLRNFHNAQSRPRYILLIIVCDS